jgi:hypothetical protein
MSPPAATDILVFVEDPGAANFIAPMLPGLASADCKVTVTAAAAGARHLAQLGVGAESLDDITEASSVFTRWSPKLVLVGTSENPETLGLKLVLAARSAGIITVGIVDGPANSAWRFRGLGNTPLEFAPDWILVPDEGTRTAFRELGYPQQNVVTVGHPHYDYVCEQRENLESIGRQVIRDRVLPGAGHRPVVTFIAEISDGLNPAQFLRDADYTLEGRGKSPQRTNIALEEVLDALALVSPHPYVVLRLHPKNGSADFEDYQGEIDFVSQTENAHEIVYASDLVVGMTSHLMVEAAILGCKTLAVLPRPQEKEWLPTIASGLTKCAANRSELRRLLADSADEWRNSPTAMLTSGQVFERGARERASGFVAHLAR